MARAEFKGRQFAIYLPTAEYLEIWKQRAKAANCSLNNFIFEAVEAFGEEGKPASSGITDELNKLRAENQQLKAELDRIRLRDDEFFKLPQSGDARDTFSPVPFKLAFINDLREGGYWSSEKINRKFQMYIQVGANPGKLLEELESLGLVKETMRGWCG